MHKATLNPTAFRHLEPFCLARPIQGDHKDGYIAGKCSNSTSVSEVPPATLAAATRPCRYQAIYCFEVSRTGKVLQWYVGETADFSTRIRHYVGMTRRMLCLHDDIKNVVLEKHPMRNIHHRLAQALVVADSIVIRWQEITPTLDKTKRIALENQVRDAARRHWGEDVKELNCRRNEANFEASPEPADVPWSTVHKKLMTCSNRRGRKGPFIV